MTQPHFYGRYRTVPATLLLETLGESLEQIKVEDKATDADLGAVLGKSEDRAASYRKGIGDMGVVSFLRGCREWDGRFANAALAMVGMRLSPLDAAVADDQASVTTLLRLTMELSAELERDGDISTEDLEKHQFLIERVGKLIDGYRVRLRQKATASN